LEFVHQFAINCQSDFTYHLEPQARSSTGPAGACPGMLRKLIAEDDYFFILSMLYYHEKNRLTKQRSYYEQEKAGILISFPSISRHDYEGI